MDLYLKNMIVNTETETFKFSCKISWTLTLWESENAKELRDKKILRRYFTSTVCGSVIIFYSVHFSREILRIIYELIY